VFLPGMAKLVRACQHPRQPRSITSWLAFLASISFYISFFVSDLLLAAIGNGAMIVFGLACVGGIIWQTTGPKHVLNSRHIDFAIVAYCAINMPSGIDSTLSRVIRLTNGTNYLSWVLFGYRGLYTIFVMGLEEILEPAFGAHALWLVFFARVRIAAVVPWRGRYELNLVSLASSQSHSLPRVHSSITRAQHETC